MIKTLLTILTGAILSSCAVKYRIIHVPLQTQENCEFEKFTIEEKDHMLESTGKRIYRNQEGCRIQQRFNNDLIEAHNKAHQ